MKMKCGIIIPGLITGLIVSGIVSSCVSTGDTSTQADAGVAGTTALLTDVPLVFQGIFHGYSIRTEPAVAEMETGFPEFPDELMAYQVVTDIDDAYARDLAEKLGFTDEQPLTGGERVVYSFTQGGRTLEIELTGRLSLRSSQDIGSVPDLPSDEECIELANAWLRDNGLYPESVERVEVGYGGKSVTTVNTETGETGDTVYYSKSVKFITCTRIEGYEIASSGASVLVGGNGEIVQASVDVSDICEYGPVQLITPQAAYEIMQGYLAMLTPDTSGKIMCLFTTSFGTRVEINKITIQYQRTSQNDYLLPVYVFEGVTYVGADLMPESFAARIDAVKR